MVFVAVDLDLKLARILKDERPVCGSGERR